MQCVECCGQRGYTPSRQQLALGETAFPTHCSTYGQVRSALHTAVVGHTHTGLVAWSGLDWALLRLLPPKGQEGSSLDVHLTRLLEANRKREDYANRGTLVCMNEKCAPARAQGITASLSFTCSNIAIAELKERDCILIQLNQLSSCILCNIYLAII